MTVEELLKPRWRVVADYPNSPYKIGELVTNDSALWVNNDIHLIGVNPDNWPAIFKRLEWWEERDLNADYPAYVKDDKRGVVFRVADPSQNMRIWHVDGEIEHRFIKNYKPATPAEYSECTEQLNKTK